MAGQARSVRRSLIRRDDRAVQVRRAPGARERIAVWRTGGRGAGGGWTGLLRRRGCGLRDDGGAGAAAGARSITPSDSATASMRSPVMPEPAQPRQRVIRRFGSARNVPPAPAATQTDRKNDGRGPAHNLVLLNACSEQGLCLREARKQAQSTRLPGLPADLIFDISSIPCTRNRPSGRHPQASSGWIAAGPAAAGARCRRSIKASGSDSVTTIPRFAGLTEAHPRQPGRKARPADRRSRQREQPARLPVDTEFVQVMTAENPSKVPKPPGMRWTRPTARHQRLPLVHGRHDSEIAKAAMRDLARDQRAGDDADDVTAMRERGVGDDTHRPHAASAERDVHAKPGGVSRDRFSRCAVFGRTPVLRPEDADAKSRQRERRPPELESPWTVDHGRGPGTDPTRRNLAEPMDGVDVSRATRVVFELLSQPCDVDVHGPRRRHRVVAPDFVEQLVARQRRAAMLDEVAEKLELARRELDELARPA